MGRVGCIFTKAHHETPATVPQHVVDLSLGEVTGSRLLDAGIRSHEGQEGRVGGVTVGSPLASERKTSWCVWNTAGLPTVQEPGDCRLVSVGIGQLVQQKLKMGTRL